MTSSHRDLANFSIRGASLTKPSWTGSGSGTSTLRSPGRSLPRSVIQFSRERVGKSSRASHPSSCSSVVMETYSIHLSKYGQCLRSKACPYRSWRGGAAKMTVTWLPLPSEPQSRDRSEETIPEVRWTGGGCRRNHKRTCLACILPQPQQAK